MTTRQLTADEAIAIVKAALDALLNPHAHDRGAIDAVRAAIEALAAAGVFVFVPDEDGANCHRCGHYETSLTRAAERYAHCPSCGMHTRWVAVTKTMADKLDKAGIR